MIRQAERMWGPHSSFTQFTPKKVLLILGVFEHSV